MPGGDHGEKAGGTQHVPQSIELYDEYAASVHGNVGAGGALRPVKLVEFARFGSEIISARTIDHGPDHTVDSPTPVGGRLYGAYHVLSPSTTSFAVLSIVPQAHA